MSSARESSMVGTAVTVRFVPLRRPMHCGNIGASESTQTSDTSDDESVYNGSHKRQHGAKSTRSTQHKMVKKAITKHVSTVDAKKGCERDRENIGESSLNVTRVVNTYKPDSVLGEGLVVSEQIRSPASAESQSGSSCADASVGRINSPAIEDIEGLREKIHEKSRHVDLLEPRDVPMNEGNSEAGASTLYKPSLMGIDPSFVPPELASFGLGQISWKHFTAALNAAIPRGTQEITNQIARWNRDAFRDHGFALSLSSIDPSPNLLVSKI